MPKLPIPKLDDTIARYKAATAAIMAPDTHEELCRAADEFASESGPGPKLQQALCGWDAAQPGTSYISELWYDKYLKDRSPLPLNLNPQLTFVKDPRPQKMEQSVRAADLVHAACRFHLTLEAQALTPDVYWGLAHPVAKSRALQSLLALTVPRRFAYFPFYFLKAYPLDMSQYPRLFRSTRVPLVGKDELRSAQGPTTHIVVQRGASFYRVEVLTPAAGAPRPPEELERAFRAVVADEHLRSRAPAGSSPAAPPVGILTTADRDTWATARQSLESESPLNAASLRDIDDALFVLTLDGSSPSTPEDVSRSMLHGCGRDSWFDKCINLKVCANGVAGVSWEHAWGDGVAVLYFFNEVFRALQGSPVRPSAPAPPVSTGTPPEKASGLLHSLGVQRLAWDLSQCPGVVSTISSAEASFDATVAGTELHVLQTDALTKSSVKASGMSPDGLAQMVLQLAHSRCHGYMPSTYESASTAGFKHGRTEVIRPATLEAAAFVRAFGARPNKSLPRPLSSDQQAQRFQALSKAALVHSKNARSAALGQGVDRHLFALRSWAARLGTGQPRLFSTPGHRVFEDIRLSTSTLESPALAGGGFGPVGPVAYSVGYGIEERGVHFHVMNHRSSVPPGGMVGDPRSTPGAHPPCDNRAFVESLHGALEDVRSCIFPGGKA